MNAEFDVTGIELETERLLLRPWAIRDVDDFFAYASDPDVGPMAGWKPHQSKEESLLILAKFVIEKKTFAIIDKRSGHAIGSIGVEFCDGEGQFEELLPYKGRELGYVLAKEYWGQGLMPEALKAVIGYLFAVLDYDFLLCGYFDFNAQSKKVQEKVGFVPFCKTVFPSNVTGKENGVLSILIHPSKVRQIKIPHPDKVIDYSR